MCTFTPIKYWNQSLIIVAIFTFEDRIFSAKNGEKVGYIRIDFIVYWINSFFVSGAEAKRLYNDAQAILQKIIRNNLLEARAIVGFYPANSVGDDIEVYESLEDTKPIAIFNGLRQQLQTDAKSTHHCLSDFIAPKESGIRDYIGVFATSAGFGCQELCDKYNNEHDDYNSIMVSALADRLSEAFAEKLHLDIR